MSQLRSGSTITLATKLDMVGKGAGYLYVDRDLNFHVSDAKPSPVDSRFQFIIEKPPQKSGGNPDLQHVYEGDDILLRSVGNGRYPLYRSNYGGTNAWELITSEHDAKWNYRDQGQGSMNMFRIVGMNQNSQGAPVLMDGQHTYGFVNVRSVAWLSASKEFGVRSAANAGPRESWFITNHLGEASSAHCATGTRAPASHPAVGARPSLVYAPNSEKVLAMTKDEKVGLSVGAILLILLAIGLGVAFYMKHKKKAAAGQA